MSEIRSIGGIAKWFVSPQFEYVGDRHRRLSSFRDRQIGSRAVYFRATEKPRVLIPMHGTKDLKPGTLRGRIHDMGLTIDEFTAKF